MSRKVIHVLHHSLSYVSPDYEKYIYDGWSARICKSILKQNDKYKLECYFPERTLKKTKVIRRDGLIYKLFPSTTLRCNYEVSRPLIKEIKKQEKSHDIILHIHGIHNWNTYALCKIFGKKIPIILQHHGEKPYLNSNLRKIVEKHAFKNIKKVFTTTQKEKQYLSKFIEKKKIEMQTMGVDFNFFKPMDKIESKKKLNISENKKVLLYVGFVYKIVEFDLLETFKKINKKQDKELILVGDDSDNQFNKKAKNMGVKIFGRLPNEKMPVFYNAADLYVFPISRKKGEWLTGIGVSVIESLACNTPVVSGSLQHFPTNEKKDIGIVLENNLETSVLHALKNLNKYKKCRELAKKYYDWSVISKNTLKIYDTLIKER